MPKIPYVSKSNFCMSHGGRYMCLSATLFTDFNLNCHYKHVNWCIKYPLCGYSNVQTFGIENQRMFEC